MRNWARYLIAIIIIHISSSASADCIFCFNPFIGADHYRIWMKGKGDYNEIFPKAYLGATLYVGAKVHPNYGFELGYDWSARKAKDWFLLQGQPFFGSQISSTFWGTVKIHRTGGHLDFVGYLPLPECFELFGTIGYGWVQPKISVLNMTLNPGVIPNTSALSTLRGRGKSVLRLGAGINFMFMDFVGLRLKAGWESTASLRVHGNTAFTRLGYDTKGFKSSATAAAGLFARF